jgi:hypothetical protein
MQLEHLRNSIEPLRQKIIHHPLYSAIESIEDLRIFMEHHVFAVWDFMSLLKSLQNQLTCTSVPWFPTGTAETRFFINEIVVGEESDVDQFGNYTSHFELYCEAMKQCGARTEQIEDFLTRVQNGKKVPVALTEIMANDGITNFVTGTFDTINKGENHLLAAVFTFGREELIPDMFYSIIKDLSDTFPEKVSQFRYYLERHIEIDGGHHAALAYKMTANLCGDDEKKWEEALDEVTKALNNRLVLWDAAYESILQNKLLADEKTHA